MTTNANPAELRETVERLAGLDAPPRDEAVAAVAALLDALEDGAVRAAGPTAEGWAVNAWVKRGILLGFRIGANRELAVDPVFHFRDRDTFPTRNPATLARDVRIVPGGTTIRRGAFVGEGVVVMPPAFVNVGAWVGEASMVDSHALVGSCAQLGARVHLSAAAQIGGVLEPIGALPVIVEDDVFVGGGCGIYEGTQILRGAVIGAGVVLTRSVPIYDLERDEVLRAPAKGPLVVPENAVVVPGSRPARGTFAEGHGLHLHAPVIVRYRDPSSDGASALEEALR